MLLPEDERKICWPDPDRVCLEGGCGYCRMDGDWKKISTVENYSKRAGLHDHFIWGLARDFVNAPTRKKKLT